MYRSFLPLRSVLDADAAAGSIAGRIAEVKAIAHDSGFV
jgi:hypothetical protein